MRDAQVTKPATWDVSEQWSRVIHGDGALESLKTEIERAGMTSILLVTTPSLRRERTLLDRVTDAIADRLAVVTDGSRQHVPRGAVLGCVKAADDARIDGIISLGGGSAVDSGKAIALALAEGVTAGDDFERYKIRFEYPDRLDSPTLTADPVPHIALPTSLSGAEYSGVIGILNEATGAKDLYSDPRLAPAAVILDPVLAAATPWALWAATGVKVVSDVAEQLCSRNLHPVLEPTLIRSMEWMVRYLPASRDRNSDAVMRCQLATWMGMFGLFASNTLSGVGAALRHQLGALYNVPHGEATCALLPHVLRYNLPAAPEAASAIQAALGIAGPGGEAVTEQIVERIASWVASVDVPTTLGQLGVPRAGFQAVADHVLEDFSILSNPRPVKSAEEVIAILDAAM